MLERNGLQLATRLAGLLAALPIRNLPGAVFSSCARILSSKAWGTLSSRLRIPQSDRNFVQVVGGDAHFPVLRARQQGK